MIGPRRDDLRAAQVVAMIYNANRGPKDRALDLDGAALRFELPPEPPG